MERRARPRWGDQIDEEDVLPPPSVTVTGPNQRTTVEYFKNDRGDVMKRTTKSKVVNVEKKVYEVRSSPACLFCRGACAEDRAMEVDHTLARCRFFSRPC